MSDEKRQGEEKPEEKKAGAKASSDSGLGNLPPLSDFDSKSGLSASDAGLPPIGSFDSGTPDDGGLPPISDIDVETPQPTGGNIKPPPADLQFASSAQGAGQPFDSGVSDTWSSGSGASDAGAGSGFQDLAADSDFSPETPEIGPGPSTPNVDTPMFDSAFGSAEGGFDAAVDTPAPTRAMETPMFGGGQAPPADGGFDQGAFGPAFGAGTPAPDFSPDTGAGAMPAPVAPGGLVVDEVPPGPPPKRTGKVLLGVGVALLVGLVGGIAASPFIGPSIPFLPNPLVEELDVANRKIAGLNQQLAEYRSKPELSGKLTISQEELDMLEQRILKATEELTQKSGDLEQATTTLAEKQEDLENIEEDIANKNEDYVTAEEMFEDLKNETAIMQARQKGLIAEVARLTGNVGQLEEANVRRRATKEALEYAVDRLVIQIKEGIPLTPEEFSHTERRAAVTDLRDKVAGATWVTPALMNAYTALYLKELEIAASTRYFFAKIPVTDTFGDKTYKWSECLMKGNHAVYYRTLDGKNIGTYEDLGVAATPAWEFREELPTRMQREIEDKIVASRVPDFREKIRVLAQKQLSVQEDSAVQRNFESL